MKRRSLIVPLLALGLLPLAAPTPVFAQQGGVRAAPLSARDRADLARIEAYLNGLHAMRARFLQIAPDGGVSEGNLWLQRPGRMRFEYDPPAPFLMVAGSGNGMFYDKQLKQVSYFPLSSTPLGILLAENIRLSGEVTVTGMQRLPGQVQVTLVRTGAPGDGSLTLVFADDPLTLRQWVVMDPQQRETRVSLFNAAVGGSFDQKLFQTADPRLPG